MKTANWNSIAGSRFVKEVVEVSAWLGLLFGVGLISVLMLSRIILSLFTLLQFA